MPRSRASKRSFGNEDEQGVCYMISLIGIIFILAAIFICLTIISICYKIRKMDKPAYNLQCNRTARLKEWERKFQESYDYKYWEDKSRGERRRFSHILPLFGRGDSGDTRGPREVKIVSSSFLYSPTLLSPDGIITPDEPDSISIAETSNGPERQASFNSTTTTASTRRILIDEP